MVVKAKIVIFFFFFWINLNKSYTGFSHEDTFYETGFASL